MSKYIVKNCPAYREGMNLPHYCKAVGCCINTYVDGTDCTTISNCLIKQVIEKCKGKHVGYIDEAYTKDEILKLFDIEEVR